MNKELYKFSSLQVSSQLQLRNLKKNQHYRLLSENNLYISFVQNKDSYFFIFKFGAMVFFNLAEQQIRLILEDFFQPGEWNFKTDSDDFYYLEVDEKLEAPQISFERAILNSLKINQLSIIAMVLGMSATLDYYSFYVDKMLKSSEKIAQDLKNFGRLSFSLKDSLKHIGECLSTEQEIFKNIFIMDVPDEVWDDQLLYKLFVDMRNMFEINGRYKNIQNKITLVREGNNIVVDIVRARNSSLLEITIIILILIELIFGIISFFES